MQDNRYVPDTLDVADGETVRFVFTNSGAVAHDAYIGDETAQDDHESEMNGDMGGHGMSEDNGAVTVEPGDTAELTHTFAAGDDVLIGCHEPGHYNSGMRLTVDVTCIPRSNSGGSQVPFVGVHALEVREHDFPIQGVAVLDEGVLHHGISHSVLVVLGEIEPAPGACLGLGRPTIEPYLGHEG